MEDVITVSSDSDSDVEILGSFTNGFYKKGDPLSLSAVRVDVDAVNVPLHYIDLSDPRWAPPERKLRRSQNPTVTAVVDLTENDADVTEEKILPPNDCQLQEESVTVNQVSNKQDLNFGGSSSKDSGVFTPQQDCGNLKPKRRRRVHDQKQSHEAHPCHPTPVIKLTRLPFLETHLTQLKTTECSVHVAKDCTDMSLDFRQLNNTSETPDCFSTLKTSTASSVSHMEPTSGESPPMVAGQQENSNEFAGTQSQDNGFQQLWSPADSPCTERGSPAAASKEHSTCENEMNDFSSSGLPPSPTVTSSSQHDAPRDDLCSNVEQLDLEKADSRGSDHSDHSPPLSPAAVLNSSELFDCDSLVQRSPISHNVKSHIDSPPTSEYIPGESLPEWDLEAEIYRGDSPSYQEGSDGEDFKKENGFDLMSVSREDRHHVCPVTLRKVMTGSTQALTDENDEGFGTPEVLCPQSLSLVYSTIEENLPESTLQLLSDLFQPGYYPPGDITSHLLRGILLNPQCPHHQCVQAFHLLMRTQRHHKADKTTVQWDWELLTSVMATQEDTKRHRCEIVRMLLEYILQTLEDDFQVKQSTSALQHSIAKATLSCDQQFHRVRDVIKWLFSAIITSTERGESRETTRETDEQIRIVSILQRMLSLSLEVDRSPALSSAKLSQELFHMLISNMSLRAHRMLLMETLQSKMLRCKLLEHLLDYACPLKISRPMSISLLLHFLQNCTLAPDRTDGTERWQKWEELVSLLWMLLLSYTKAMKGYLCSSFTEQRDRVGTVVYRPGDIVSKAAVREAVESFLSRSQADLGQALPLHVEESLSYLQDHLLDVCQC